VTGLHPVGADPVDRPEDVDSMQMPMVTAVSAGGGPDAVLEHIGPRAAVIVPLANGVPLSLLDAVEAHASVLDGVRVHQLHATHDRPHCRDVRRATSARLVFPV
jgi:hypothetical protein